MTRKLHRRKCGCERDLCAYCLRVTGGWLRRCLRHQGPWGDLTYTNMMTVCDECARKPAKISVDSSPHRARIRP